MKSKLQPNTRACVSGNPSTSTGDRPVAVPVSQTAAGGTSLTLNQCTTGATSTGATLALSAGAVARPTLAATLLKDLLKTRGAQIAKSYLLFEGGGVRTVDDPARASKVDPVRLRNCMFLDLAVHLSTDALKRQYTIDVMHSVDGLLARFIKNRRASGKSDDCPLALDEFMSLTKAYQQHVGQTAAAISALLDAAHPGVAVPRGPLSQEQLAMMLHGPPTAEQALKNEAAKIRNTAARKFVIDHGQQKLKSDPRFAAEVERAARFKSLMASGLADMGVACVRGLGWAFGYPSPLRPIVVHRVTQDQARARLRALQDGQALGEVDMAELLLTLRSEPELARAVTECTQCLLKNLATGTAFDQNFGAWQVAAALVLCLPEEALAQFMFAPRVVELLRDEARVLMGAVHYRHELNRNERLDQARGSRRIRALTRLAQDAARTPHGQALADKLDTSLRVLESNARKLEQFLTGCEKYPNDLAALSLPEILARMQQASGPLAEPARPRHAFLQPSDVPLVEAEEPSDGEHAGDDDQGLASAEPTPSITVTAPLNDSDDGVDTIPAQHDIAPVKVHLPPQEHKGPVPRPKRPNRQSGAREDLPSAHYHPGELEGLTKQEAKLRRLKISLVNRGLLDPYGVLTQARFDALQDEMRNDRLRRNLGSEVVEGGRLVKGDPLQAPTTRTGPPIPRRR